MIKRNDLSKTSGSSPTGATKTSQPAKQSAHPERKQPWFVVDKEGLRKTLSRKGKAFAIYELLQNGYDERGPAESPGVFAFIPGLFNSTTAAGPETLDEFRKLLGGHHLRITV
jgi:hypothetical protein